MSKRTQFFFEDPLPFLKNGFLICATVGQIKGLQYALSGLGYCSV